MSGVRIPAPPPDYSSERVIRPEKATPDFGVVHAIHPFDGVCIGSANKGSANRPSLPSPIPGKRV